MPSSISSSSVEHPAERRSSDPQENETPEPVQKSTPAEVPVVEETEVKETEVKETEVKETEAKETEVKETEVKETAADAAETESKDDEPEPVASEEHEPTVLERFGLPARLINNKQESFSRSDIEAKCDVVGIYFGSLSCSACKDFVPAAAEHYAKYNEGITSHPKKYEIVYVSCDKTSEEFTDAMASCPWLTIPLEDGDARQKSLESFNISGLPSLILLDPKTGEVLTEEGVMGYNKDRSGERFPWPGLKKSLFQRMLPVIIQRLPMIVMMLFMFYRNVTSRRQLNSMQGTTTTTVAMNMVEAVMGSDEL
ncbi:MAG: hypothetical protein KVP17_004135 [Porospora cf. gigantea B]|uniref:uncharacterized protein n=1 Tax=Porospora cf. gigantea B TaxID=2853592 RepID=UPI003571C5EB|nr:MAG: hypothetical protein KVP17_004135 [Porospora cf. gigantea B]